MFLDSLKEGLESIKEAQLYRQCNGSQGISFVDNDYLGLSRHPSIRDGLVDSLEVFGNGSRGSRLLGGTSHLTEELESTIAQFFGAPSALFFSTGYLANLAVTSTLAEKATAILSDEYNHASLIDGLRLAKVPKKIVPHLKWQDVAREEWQPGTLVVTESLFSMDGDIPDLDFLVGKVENSGCFLILDEAHAAGVFSEQGRGLWAKTTGWENRAVVVTFGKAFGVSGSAVLCHPSVREYLINRARPFIYSTAPSPAQMALVLGALQVMETEGYELRRELWQRVLSFRAEVSKAFPSVFYSPQAVRPDSRAFWETRSPIVPLPIPGDDNALRFCKSMRESGVDFRAIRYPTVAKGSERVRVCLNLNVSSDVLYQTAEQVVRVWKEFL